MSKSKNKPGYSKKYNIRTFDFTKREKHFSDCFLLSNMAVLSKPVWVSPTCYELGHCWTPYCTKASTDVAKNVFTEALKIYGTLYMMAGLIQKKGARYYLQRFVPETLQSSIFLTINGTLFISMFCLWRRLVGFYVYYNVFICGIPICILSILIENKSRHLLGCMYFLTASFIPAFVGAFTAVHFERKSRRGPLAVYLTNLAIETGYRMLVERKIVSPVPNGEVFLFSAVSAVYLYLFRKQNGLSPSVESLFKLFVGSEENPKRNSRLESKFHRSRGKATEAAAAVLRAGRSSISGSSPPSPSSRDSSSKASPSIANNNSSFPTDGSSTSSTTSSSNTTIVSSNPGARTSADTGENIYPSSSSSHASGPSKNVKEGLSSLTLVGFTQGLVRRFPFLEEPLGRVLETLSAGVTWIESFSRHKCCPHQHSCLSYILKGGSRNFAVGYGLQAVISTLSVITTVLRRPSALRDTLFSRLNLKLAAFMGAYSAVFRAVNCVLRWIRGKDAPIHGLVGGALAGLSLRFYRSVTIALYAATKLVEILYFKGIESCGFPYIKSADIFIYAFSTAFIFHAAVMEPHTLRPGYWKFLLRVTGNKFAMMNRKLLDIFGVNSSKIAPDYWPNYDPAFTELARGPS